MTQSRRSFLSTVSAAGAGAVLAAGNTQKLWARAAASRPNIIYIMVDDLGYGDVGFNGKNTHPVLKTPQTDAWAKKGSVWSQFYSCPTCTPSRISAFTGRTPLVFDEEIEKYGYVHLPFGVYTIPHLLNSAGYNTAYVGSKWHMGEGADDPTPNDHGFDIAIKASMGSYSCCNDKTFSRNGEKLPAGDYPNRIAGNAGYAMEVLEELSAKPEPFYLQLWHFVPHGPYDFILGYLKPILQYECDQSATFKQMVLDLYGNQKTLAECLADLDSNADKIKALGEQISASSDKNITSIKARLMYNSMVSAMDDNVGKLRDKIDALGIASNTLVFFCSDNGPTGPVGKTGGLKGSKFSVWEGGIRVPAFMVWPGTIAENSTTTDAACLLDLLPTFCNLAGIALPEDGKFEGISLVPRIKANNPLPNRTIYLRTCTRFHTIFGSAAGAEECAIENGEWKLIVKNDKASDPADQTVDDFLVVGLYNLKNDLQEKTNLASQYPDRVATMKANIIAWKKSLPDNWVEKQFPLPMATQTSRDISAGLPKSSKAASVSFSKGLSGVNPTLTLRVPQPQHISLELVDSRGASTVILKDRFMRAGSYPLKLNGHMRRAGGVYYTRLKTANMKSVGKFVLAK